MSKIKKLLTVVLAGTMLLSLTSCGIIKRTEESKGKTVLAKVGDEKIRLEEVDKLIYSTLESYKTYYGEDFETNEEVVDELKEVRTQALESLIAEKLLLSKQKELGVKISDEEIDSEVEETISYYKETYEDEDSFKEFLTSYGYDEKGFREYLKNNVILSKIADAVVEDVTVTDEEVKAYYDENVDSFTLNPGANVTHIVFTDLDTGYADAVAARELVLQGKKFEEIAEMDKYKDKSKAEDLGYQDFEDNSYLVSEFVDGFKNLTEGVVSEPVQTSYGWHLILTSGTNKESKVQSFDEIKDTVKEQALFNKKSEVYSERIEEYKKEADVKIYKDRL